MLAHKMAPITSQWLKERASDTPTKGLLWQAQCEGQHFVLDAQGAVLALVFQQ